MSPRPAQIPDRNDVAPSLIDARSRRSVAMNPPERVGLADDERWIEDGTATVGRPDPARAAGGAGQ